MIFAILDDLGLVVHSSIDDACRGHEPVDVESGDVHFFDDDGWPLDPVFVVPNRYGEVLGVTVIEQGSFVLQRRVLGTEADGLNVAIERVRYLQPNQHFASVDAIRNYVANARPGTETAQVTHANDPSMDSARAPPAPQKESPCVHCILRVSVVGVRGW